MSLQFPGIAHRLLKNAGAGLLIFAYVLANDPVVASKLLFSCVEMRFLATQVVSVQYPVGAIRN